MLSPTTALLLGAAGAAAFVATGAAGPSGAAAAAPTVTLQNAASTSTPSVPPDSTSATKTSHKRGALSGRGLHADFVAKGKAGTFITAASQRGVVTAVSPTAVTLKSDDGFTRSYVVVAATKVTKERAEVAESTIATGAKAVLVAVKNGDAYEVRHIALPSK